MSRNGFKADYETSSYSSADDGDHIDPTTRQESEPDNSIPSENKLEDTFVRRVVVLDEALLSLKETADHILNGPQGQSRALRLEVNNPQTRRRTKLSHGNFIRLSRWLGSTIDILGQYIWLGENDSESREGLGDKKNEGGGGEGEAPVAQDDINTKLVLSCNKGYSELIKEAESLLEINGDPPEESTTSRRIECLKEEQCRIKVWMSNTGIDKGEMSILANHDLYKQTGGVLENILVDLATLCEECFINDPSFVGNSNGKIGISLVKWLEEAKRLLVILPGKSAKTEDYLSSHASDTTPRGVALTPEELRDEGENPSGASLQTLNSSTSASTTPRAPPYNRPLGYPDPAPGSRPISRGSMDSSTSFPIVIDQTPLPEYLLDSLKGSNDVLFPLVRSLEMAKANLGEGTHSQVYRAVREIKASQKPQHAEAPPPARAPAPSLRLSPYLPKVPTVEVPLETPRRPSPVNKYQPRKKRTGKKPAQQREPAINGPEGYSSSNPEEPNDPNNTSPTQALLWDKIKSAAFIGSNDLLNPLLSELDDVGFGLYCERHAPIFDAEALDVWVVIEILLCMWRGDSRHMKESFGKKAKALLSGSGVCSNPQPPGNNWNGQPNNFAEINTENQNNPPQAPPPGVAQQYTVGGRYSTTYYPEVTVYDRGVSDISRRTTTEYEGPPYSYPTHRSHRGQSLLPLNSHPSYIEPYTHGQLPLLQPRPRVPYMQYPSSPAGSYSYPVELQAYSPENQPRPETTRTHPTESHAYLPETPARLVHPFQDLYLPPPDSDSENERIHRGASTRVPRSSKHEVQRYPYQRLQYLQDDSDMAGLSHYAASSDNEYY